MRVCNILISLLVTLTSSVSAKNFYKAKDATLLSNVRSLTVRGGQKTTARRVSPIPQLSCVGGNAKGLYDVDIMRCKNSGSEYDPEDIQWTCKAELPPEFKLGSTDVICEGYDSPDDHYILKGSCGVEYRLVLTDLGEEKYGSNAFQRAYRRPSGETIGGALFSLLFWVCFIGVIAVVLYRIFFPVNRAGNNFRNDFRQNYFGGGGGGDDDDGRGDPPPPYTPRAPKPSSAYRANRAPSGNSNYPNQGQQWRPGFWTGAATGAAAGYAASALGGDRNQRAQQSRYYDPQPQAGPSNWFGRTRDPSPPRAGGSWFGGNGGSNYYGGGAPSRSSSGSQPSSSRYDSTGFGGTRRR
ncbi:hypothetical protein KC332_g14094 [Hortaea werneckii]|uniref:Store-operated calcium entry-associated regulatory factor n=1 Tax=Hortaea werneckii EXF-2000 TaxID=1157616 RepID=A0A1Z5T256_HORWE|nr:hypothetical protein KC358_g8592 [Hortaea werneckii]OTA29225.1 hypothetical protein BTJ68_13121 [Hortaea werneckii EXF-2000]KAI6832441.1 hypothetical protein KC350_g7149 [Hortaea werneckii]KAI6838820.1 hypothetical protein KC342_g3820 [Hortaea werneckii]KAI6932671.1 hypothetical protein KC348_g6923 [Hortaea werneckii]